MVLTQMIQERLNGVGFSIDGPKDKLSAPGSSALPKPVELKASFVPPASTVVNSLKIAVSTAN